MTTTAPLTINIPAPKKLYGTNYPNWKFAVVESILISKGLLNLIKGVEQAPQPTTTPGAAGAAPVMTPLSPEAIALWTRQTEIVYTIITSLINKSLYNFVQGQYDVATIWAKLQACYKSCNLTSTSQNFTSILLFLCPRWRTHA